MHLDFSCRYFVFNSSVACIHIELTKQIVIQHPNKKQKHTLGILLFKKKFENKVKKMIKKRYSNNYQTVKIAFIQQSYSNYTTLTAFPKIHHEKNTFLPINENKDNDDVECLNRCLYHTDENENLDGQNFTLRSLWKAINDDDDDDDVSALTEFSCKIKARKLLESVSNPPPIETNTINNGVALTVAPSRLSSELFPPTEISISCKDHSKQWSPVSHQSNQTSITQTCFISDSAASYQIESKENDSGSVNTDESSDTMIHRCDAFDEDDDLQDNEIDSNSTPRDYRLNIYSQCMYRLSQPSRLQLEEPEGFRRSNNRIDNIPLRCRSCPPPAPKHHHGKTKQSYKFKRFSWKKHQALRFCHSF